MANLASVGGQAVPTESNDASPEVALTASSTRPDPTEGEQRRKYRMLHLALGVIRLGPVLILAGLVIAMTMLSPVFLTTGNAGNLLSQTAAIAVLAIGQLLVILTRGIDLSVGSTLALASVLGAIAFAHGSSGWVVIIVMIATGAAVGFVNGAV
ncbi:MAG: ABC transporter permease, partial [Ilumatobacteraceae bacterium]